MSPLRAARRDVVFTASTLSEAEAVRAMVYFALLTLTLPQ
jgi:hypothetical protein